MTCPSPRVSQEHHDYLNRQAISDAFIDAVCETTAEGIVFHFVGTSGTAADQLRLDKPKKDGPRFIGPPGQPSVMPVPPGYDSYLADLSKPLVIVEGSKGILAAASAMAGTTQPVALVGLLGCWGWSSDGQPTDDLMAIPAAGRDVTVILDADLTSNRNVWDAAEALKEQLKTVLGAKSVKFAHVPGRNKEGIDDLLSRVPEADRERLVRRVIDSAKESLGRRPAKQRAALPSCFDDNGTFLARTCFDLLMTKHPMACTQENTVAVYRAGRYHNGESKQFNASVVDLLGEYFRETYLKTVHELAVSILKTTGRVIPIRPDRLLINVRNGLLDPVTLTLHPHHPEYLTLFQFDVKWDPSATCPTYDAWLEQVLPGRGLELEDAVAPMLNPLVTPSKAVFMYGPSRSGKSTFGRLLAAVVGKESTSSVSLQQLSDDKFASANLYGKCLNLAMDLSSRDVRDLSLFKMLTGDDLVPANRKYGQQFNFTNTALVVFSANEVPTVSETSKAWTARVAPFKFPNSFLGAEDPSIEQAMLAELPGIFRRWVLALQAQLVRGGYIEAPSHTEEFIRKTNRVAEFLAERTMPSANPEGTLRPSLYAEYRLWAEANGGQPMGRNRFFDSVRTMGVEEFKPKNGAWTFEVVLTDPEKAEPVGNSDEVGSSVPSPLTGNDSQEEDLVSRNARVVPELPTDHQIADAVVFDLETGSASNLWTFDPEEFVRVVGIEGAEGVRADHRLTVPSGTPLVAHNGFQFDFHALARRDELDILAAGEAGRLLDTKVLAALAYPPPFDMKPEVIEKHFGLNRVAQMFGLPGKTDDIKRLARRHHTTTPHPSGDPYMSIPVDDTEYLSYCRDDVRATRAILDRLPITEYAKREMRLLARLASSVTGIGFRIDTDLLDARYAAGQQRLAERRQWLIDTYGMPSTRKDGSCTSTPQKTEEGMSAILAAFKTLGADPADWPSSMRTKAGAPSLGKSAMAVLIEQIGDDSPAVAELARVVMEMNGERTVYGNVLDNLAEGRVHPTISARQASGRLSITKPGLTVIGKRDGRWVEREVFLPEQGHVIVPFDLDQVDARAVAGLCQDQAYMALFTDPTIDSHEEIAYRLWGVRDGKKGVYRNKAKVIGHAWNYGAGVKKIVEQTGIPRDDVERFDAGMRSDFPLLVQWKQDMASVAATGALMDNGFGRMMRPDPDRAHTQGPALMGQGAARDLMMGGILRLPVEVVPMLRAVVHDEIVLSIPKDIVNDVIPVIQQALTDEFRGIPITSGYEKPSWNWGRCYAPKESK